MFLYNGFRLGVRRAMARALNWLGWRNLSSQLTKSGEAWSARGSYNFRTAVSRELLALLLVIWYERLKRLV